MDFGDVASEAGLKTLNTFLADKSYIEGFVPSSGDASVFDAAVSGGKPDGAKFCHAARWFTHIQSFEAAGRKQFPKSSNEYTAGGAAAAADDDEDVDLFGSDDDDEAESAEAAKVREERLAAYAEKKAKKPGVIAKTSVVLDCKPWDDETDMAEMQKMVRTIEMAGLLWGASKLVEVGYGIKKLSIMCVVEDAKVSIDELQEKITDFEDFVQSCDVATMQKI